MTRGVGGISPLAMVSVRVGAPPSLTKVQLRQLADGLLLRDAEAVERCVAFMTGETRGLWHGRARAMMARRLKHCALTPSQAAALVACITSRLETGLFSEQFDDQLHLAMQLDAPTTAAVCRRALTSPRPYVRRHAARALAMKAARGA